MKVCENCRRKKDNRSFTKVAAIVYISKQEMPLICNQCYKKNQGSCI
jgi:hypothetical protein